MSTHKFSVIVTGNLRKGGEVSFDAGQSIIEAIEDSGLFDESETPRLSFRLNGADANGDEEIQEGDRVTAIPQVKAGA